LGRLGKALLFACAAILFAPALASADGPPLFGASWVEGVTSTGASGNAELDPNGFQTSFRFEYLSEAAYRANLDAEPPRDPFFGAAATPSGSIGAIAPPKSVSRGMSGLSPATAYRYRPVATNEKGTTPGPVHVFTTKESGTEFHLPDNRRWEMVSPADKNGGEVAAPGAIYGGGDIQATAVAGGEAAPLLTYGSITSFGESAGAPPASQYASRRTASGWFTGNISTPLDSAAYGQDPDGAPYRLFSTDLSRALLFGGLACREALPGCPGPNEPLPGTGAPPGYVAYYLRDNASGSLTSLLRSVDVTHSAVAPQNFEVAFAAASPGLSHVVLSSCAALSEGAAEIPSGPGECDPAATNLYEWSAGGLKLLNGGTPGAAIAAPGGAVSSDGSRVYWTRGGNLFLSEGAQSFQVDEAQGGGGAFQTATPDGSVAFFTKAGHLYRFLAATKSALDIAPGAGVVGVLGASADGNDVYYQDASGLQHWHAGTTVTVAPGPGAAAAGDYPPATGTSRVSADGLHLAFLSTASLTGYDNTDATTKLPGSELFLYGPPPGGGSPQLICASCNPTGERPIGPSTIPGALVNGTTLAYKPRALSASGLRIFFDSGDSIGDKDTNRRPDVYEWEYNGVGDCARSPGCVKVISRGNGNAARFLDATADGSDAFFITSESLVGADPKGSVDAYDARVNGGFSEASPVIECIGDNCQPLPGEPDDPTPGTLVQNPGNPPLHIFEPRKKKKLHLKHRKHHRHHHGGSGR
jgi:hypothetical protein